MEITGFTQDVTMTFAYPADATLESQGISEYHLIPMYFSSLAATWILPKGYEGDTVNNEIEMSLDHF